MKSAYQQVGRQAYQRWFILVAMYVDNHFSSRNSQ